MAITKITSFYSTSKNLTFGRNESRVKGFELVNKEPKEDNGIIYSKDENGTYRPTYTEKSIPYLEKNIKNLYEMILDPNIGEGYKPYYTDLRNWFVMKLKEVIENGSAQG